jgi:hypothetical protein
MHFRKLGEDMAITHWSKVGESVQPGQEPLIAPGVRGVAFNMTDGIYIAFIRGEGIGTIRPFLDDLPKSRRVVFPNVVSDKLRHLLKERGFVAAWDAEGECEIMERLPTKD